MLCISGGQLLCLVYDEAVGNKKKMIKRFAKKERRRFVGDFVILENKRMIGDGEDLRAILILDNTLYYSIGDETWQQASRVNLLLLQI